ncbi:hypothetical protein ACLK2H_04355 [Escherichia coli]
MGFLVAIKELLESIRLVCCWTCSKQSITCPVGRMVFALPSGDGVNA